MVTVENKQSYCGESTDEKPTDAEINAKFEELDTGNVYYFDGTTWSKVGGVEYDNK